MAECAELMMVLAMHVIGDGPAERDEFRAGQNGRKPEGAIGIGLDAQTQEIEQREARIRDDDARFAIEGVDAVKPSRLNQAAAEIEARIAIGAAEPAYEAGAQALIADELVGLLGPGRAEDPLQPVMGASPGQRLAFLAPKAHGRFAGRKTAALFRIETGLPSESGIFCPRIIHPPRR